MELLQIAAFLIGIVVMSLFLIIREIKTHRRRQEIWFKNEKIRIKKMIIGDVADHMSEKDYNQLVSGLIALKKAQDITGVQSVRLLGYNLENE